MKKSSQGFTLIELVVVITILGILAAFAIPRFAGLEREARIAAINGLAGSVRSGAVLAHSLNLAKGDAHDADATMEGADVTMEFRYPTQDDAGIFAVLQDATGFTTADDGVFTKDGATDEATCAVTYTAPGAIGQSPGVAVATAGC